LKCSGVYNEYICLLRGINVSGKNIIKMEHLRIHLKSIKLQGVQTYIQSVNIIFNTEEKNINKIQRLILTKIKKEYNFQVKAIIKTKEQILDTYKKIPFKNTDASKTLITFLSEPINPKEATKLLELYKSNTEEIIITKDTIYLHCPNGYGKTKLSNPLIEKKLKTPATTRNIKTIRKIIELSK